MRAMVVLRRSLWPGSQACGQMKGSNNTSAANEPVPELASIAAVWPDSEWNTPTAGFGPNVRSTVCATTVISRTNVGIACVLSAPTAFHPWLRKS